MSLSIGIVGLPNVGKSTLFNALTKKSVPCENYPFCTINPSVGVVAVPDDRLYSLANFSQTNRVIPAVIEFVDIAGLVEGASRGEGLGNKFLSNIREVDAILHMVRIFEIEDNTPTEQTHIYGTIDPLRDIKVINIELILADMESVQNRITKIIRDVKRGDIEAIFENNVCRRLLSVFEDEKMANSLDLTDDEERFVRSLNLLTIKPVIYGLNKKTGGNNINISNPDGFEKIIKEVELTGSQFVILDAKTEFDLSGFEKEEKKMIVEDLNHNDGIDELIRKSYKLLGLMTYFTTGKDETRAWTVNVGSVAPKAGAIIHSDFETKFIRAQVINWEELINAGSFAEARAKGKLRIEGKDYIVQDGDVVEFMV